MLAMFSPVSLEAQKIITVSIGKINASRVTRTGASLHKSLLVTTMLHKARNIYFEEERERAARYPCPPSPELTVTPVCLVNNISLTNIHDDKENRLDSREDEVAVAERTGEESRLPLAEANTGNMTQTTTTTTTVTSITATITCNTTSSSQNSRKRRRVSDQETAAAISSILPKRLRSELKEDSTKQEVKCVSEIHNTEREEERPLSSVLRPCETNCLSVPTRVNSLPDVSTRISVPPSERGTVHEDNSSFVFCYEPHSNPSFTTTQDDNKEEESTADDSEDSDSDDSASDTSSSSCGEMEVDHLTSLVSYFSFSQTQKQSDYCLVPLHHSQSAPHIVALTA